ncbi:MAG TPA: GatB/YqeY domain-containing protein [Methylophilaceae bacterium]|nr:GatB/YqeY domain-containing protein [Methylophilaceae bacterium]
MSLKAQITEDMKVAMRAKDSAKLGAIRLLQAAIKQREVDERIELDDLQVIEAIEKMLKQRRDSIAQYEAANRHDLADAEKYEVGVLQAYLPQALTEAEVEAILEKVVASTGASGIKDMGKVMAAIKPLVVGRADMAKISGLIKARLSA